MISPSSVLITVLCYTGLTLAAYGTSTSSIRSTSNTASTSLKPPSPLWGQCGGRGWTGSTECAEGTCVYYNVWFSQCIPNTTTISSTTGTTTTTSTNPYSSSASRSTSKSSTTSSTSTTKPYSSSSSRSASTSSTTSKYPSAPLWGQCGGSGWTGPTECAAGTCVYLNVWHSQCLPDTTTTATATGASTTTTTTTNRYP